MFTGETTNVTNPELIWGTTQNITDQQDVVFPLKLGGNSSISIPQRIVDAYRMADGRDINNASAEYPYEDRPYDQTCVTDADKQISKNYTLPGGTYKAYDNREPRFYASIGFSGALWQMQSTTSEEMRNKIVEYYNGANAGKNQAGVTNIYNLTGYTCYKYVHPRDARTGSNARTVQKTFPLIRYAEILLSYAEALNNLTKTLSFNMYDICYAVSDESRRQYIEYIDEQYNADRLTKILRNVSDIIGAHVLNVASQDYDPQGASVTILISEEEVHDADVVCHLDKSHLTVHTYPESHPQKGIMTFRADIDVSTCGRISPLNALNYLLDSFDSDIVTLDYRVRGFTRDVNGKKLFIDHRINSIQNYIAPATRNRYDMIDVNVYQENIFHTKMVLHDFDLDNYLFNITKEDLTPRQQQQIRRQVRQEMLEIYNGRNMPSMR